MMFFHASDHHATANFVRFKIDTSNAKPVRGMYFCVSWGNKNN